MDNVIQIRIDTSTKIAAKRVLDRLGVDMSTAVKVYLKQIALTKGIPFRLVTPNGLTPQEEQTIQRASIEAGQEKNVTKAMSTRAAIEYLKKM